MSYTTIDAVNRICVVATLRSVRKGRLAYFLFGWFSFTQENP